MNGFMTKKNIIIMCAILFAILAFVFLFTNLFTIENIDDSGEKLFKIEKLDDAFNQDGFNGKLMMSKVFAIAIMVAAAATLILGIISFIKEDFSKFVAIAVFALAVFAIGYFISGLMFINIGETAKMGIGLILPFVFGLIPAIGGIFLIKDWN